MCKENMQKQSKPFSLGKGGPLMHIIAAKQQSESSIRNRWNAKTLAQAMIDEGFNLVSGKPKPSDVSGSAEHEYYRKRTAEQTGQSLYHSQ